MAQAKYSRGGGRDIKNEMHRYKRGTAKSGPDGKGGHESKAVKDHGLTVPASRALRELLT